MPEQMPEQTFALPSVEPCQMTLKNMAGILFRRKTLVLTLFTGLVAIVALAPSVTPHRYESRMKILVKNARADSAVLNGDIGENQINSEVELITSNDVLARVVGACRLYEHAPGSVQAAGEPPPETFERAVRKLQRDLKITPVRKANVIQITYSAPSAETAAAVLKNLCSAYLDAHLSVHRTPGTQEFFRDQAARCKSQLLNAENRLSNFRRRNNLMSIADQKELVVRKAMDAEAELRQTDTALTETDSRLRELRIQVAGQDRRIVTQNRVGPNQNSVERLNTMLAELENRRTQALMKFHPGDRIVTEIEQEIANTRAAFDRASRLTSVEESTDVNPLRRALEGDLANAELQEAGLKVRRPSLASILAGYRARLAQLENDTIEHDSLQRTVKESEENYLLYARKQEEARIADSLDQQKIANVAVAEAPMEQRLPAKSNVNLSLGVLLAGFVSLGAAFGVEYAGSRFHTPAELESATGFPVLATVPLENL
jgi:uncharacterized protein involved in exopolysaccharide biosynthesis